MANPILIVDDSKVVRDALSKLLKGMGAHEIVEADNGLDAVQLALETNPSLIILDLAMPRMDGLAAARAIRKTHAEVPILMHTLYWSPQVEVEALKAGVNRIVPKSKSSLFIAEVQELLQAKAASSASTERAPAGPGAQATVASVVPIVEAKAAETEAPATLPPASPAEDPGE
ncbi:MAG TPA: response regulator [Verrucomicrobiae bacterium]|nr:response regulator [Verrucomicrobiae bacterium]